MENKTDYPIFRKLSNNRSYYKIISNREFEEFQVIGSKIKRYLHVANQYPEILFIQDLILFSHDGIIEGNEIEWNSLTKKYCSIAGII